LSLTYLASPYSKYPLGREQAFKEVCKKAADLMDDGYEIFCPIAHSHPIEKIGMIGTRDGDYWLKQDMSVLQHCKKLIVYMMPGWDTSYGVNKEVEFAKNNNIEVEFLPYEQTGTGGT